MADSIGVDFFGIPKEGLDGRFGVGNLQFAFGGLCCCGYEILKHGVKFPALVTAGQFIHPPYKLALHKDEWHSLVIVLFLNVLEYLFSVVVAVHFQRIDTDVKVVDKKTNGPVFVESIKRDQ